MTLISVSDAKTSFSKLINRAAYGRERIVQAKAEDLNVRALLEGVDADR